MKIRVEMLAFGENGQFREVSIPNDRINSNTDTQKMLDLVFEFGQNENQPMPYSSVSVGDVIHYSGEYWRVAPIGFVQMWDTGLENYRQLSRIERMTYVDA